MKKMLEASEKKWQPYLVGKASEKLTNKK